MSNGSGNVSNIVQPQGITSGSGAAATTIPVTSVTTSNIVTIGGGNNNTSSATFNWLTQTSAGQYQVPSGKTFYITDIWLSSSAANTGNGLGYATASFSNTTGTTPTGAVMLLGSTATAVGQQPFSSSVAAQGTYNHFSMLGLSFPALSYPFWNPSQSGQAVYWIITGFVE